MWNIFFFFNRFQSFNVIKRQIWEKSMLQEKKVKKKTQQQQQKQTHGLFITLVN